MNTDLITRLKLIERSPCDNDGWSKCTTAIFTQLISETPDNLIEKRLDGDVHYVRLTPEAKIVLKWT